MVNYIVRRASALVSEVKQAKEVQMFNPQRSKEIQRMFSIIIVGLSILLGIVISNQPVDPNKPVEVRMDIMNVQPWLDSIKSLPKDQQRAKLEKAIEAQINSARYRAERLMDAREESTGSKSDRMDILVLQYWHEQVAAQIPLLKKALKDLEA